jgi:hypothetical protein
MMRFGRVGMLVAVAATIAACSGNGGSASGKVGPAGGVLRTQSGVTLTVPKGAIAAETELRIREAQPRDGAVRRIELEPRDLKLGARVTVSVRSGTDAAGLKLVGIEQGPGGEVEHALEAERHDARDDAREAELEHLGTLEVRHGATCDPACDATQECDDGVCKAPPEAPATCDPACGAGFECDGGVCNPEPEHPAMCDPACDAGFECDDGVCKAHPEDPAPASGTTPVTCPDGMELDASDGICEPHGGATDPAPTPATGTSTDPAPAPTATACPDGMELDATDGTCKPHGGSGGGSGTP